MEQFDTIRDIRDELDAPDEAPAIVDDVELDLIPVHLEQLVYGEAGTSVAALQTRLAELDRRPLEVSGVFDDETEAALRRTQRGLGFRPDRPGEGRVTREQAARIFQGTTFIIA